VPNEYDNNHWSHKFCYWLDDLDFDFQGARLTMDSKLRQFRFIDQEIRDVSTQLRKHYKKEYKTDYTLLRSIPGIGGIE
jgi:transposase